MCKLGNVLLLTLPAHFVIALLLAVIELIFRTTRGNAMKSTNNTQKKMSPCNMSSWRVKPDRIHGFYHSLRSFQNDRRVSPWSHIVAIGAIAILLASCGEVSTVENITQVNQSGIEVISDVSKLPKCNKDNDGEMVWVKGEVTPRKCSNSKWFAVAEGSVAATCSTKELKDGSGVKIICGGDSIGVVLNGKDGKDGADGKDGKDGAKGEKGDKGDTGATGAQGKQGVAGKTGATGATGAKGDKGDTGATGAQGEKGDKGDTGATGARGEKGDTGATGNKGEKGDTGAAGADCLMETIDEQSVRVICGNDSTILYTGSAPSETTQDTVVLDSEKIAISLDEVSGVTQKGPFLMGSKVLVREMEDGRTLTQTGNSFNGKILNDNGEFKINARMLVSQYVMLEATGYYRNEVTGQNSNSELTLFAITDVNDRNVVNINLLTHLEYERVIYLVTQEKMKVRAAKKQAQKEVFGLLGIDATEFSNSEDLNIAGSSDEDGALLAFSLMFQGDRSVADLTALLQTVANGLEMDGTWDDATTCMEIAEWSADADSAGRLDSIRNNVAGWGLSSKVPNFEQFVRNFWYKEYGLDSCTAKKAGTVKAASAGKQKGTKTRYICKDATEGVTASDFRWVIASDLEKDTYGWKDTTDGALKNGSMTGKKYVFDKTGSMNGTKGWRLAVAVENTYGGCVDSLYSKIRSYRSENEYEAGYYQCQKDVHKWVLTDDNLMIDTQGWPKGDDGLSKWGDSIGVVSVTYGDRICYVYDTSAAYRGWRMGNDRDCTLGLQGCTMGRAGIMMLNKNENTYYVCDGHYWGLAGVGAELACRNEGVCRLCTEGMLGLTENRDGVMYVCDLDGWYNWREFNCAEKLKGVCTKNDSSLVEACEKVGGFDIDYICSEGHWHAVESPFEYTLAQWNKKRDAYNAAAVKAKLHSDSMVTDPRDNNVYRTVVINGKRVFAENLRYADSAAVHNLRGRQIRCYGDEAKNCEIGGGYYTWTAAMNLNGQWGSYSAETLIKDPHQGICPEGWHVPSGTEWMELFSGVDYADQQMIGFSRWNTATDASGFTALPVGAYGENAFSNGSSAGFWSASEDGYYYAKVWYLYDAAAGLSSRNDGFEKGRKYNYMAVRCFQDSPVKP